MPNINEQDPKYILEKINEARAWAKDHFNENDTTLEHEDDILSFLEKKPACFLDFPAPDLMIVSPSIFGRRSTMGIPYRLAFSDDGTMYWVPKGLFTEYFPKLEVKL